MTSDRDKLRTGNPSGPPATSDRDKLYQRNLAKTMASMVDGKSVPISALVEKVLIPSEQRAAIARLAKQGGMRYPQSGQYFSESATPEFRHSFPSYDILQLRNTFPKVLQIDFDSEVVDGEPKLVALLKDGNETMEVQLGSEPPASTELLIEKIHAHIRGELNIDSLRETKAVFEGFDDDEQ